MIVYENYIIQQATSYSVGYIVNEKKFKTVLSNWLKSEEFYLVDE